MPRFSVPVLCFLIFGIGGLTSIANGQELLPTAITSTTESFTPSQITAVDRYVERWAGQLIAGQSATSVSNARRRLLEPMKRPGATVNFKDQYSSRLATELAPGVDSSQMTVRLNTMIVAASMTGGAGLGLAREGMTDSAVAVRYWAAKAAADALTVDEGETVPDAARQRIAEAIIPIVPNEKAGKVREQYIIALAEADTAGSRAALMDAMDNRVADYAADGLSGDLSAEANGLRRLYRSLLEAKLEGADNDAEIRRLVAITARYLQVIRDAMADQQLSDGLTAIVQDLVTTAETILNWGLRVFNPSAGRGPALIEPFRAEDKTQFLFNVGEWVDRLRRSPIGLTAEDLSIE